MDLKPIEKLRPFQKFCITIGELPVSYLESLTYLELLYWFLNFLQEKVIPAVNNNAEAVEELQTLFTQLNDYVENYFDNLDVQDEINNKLDEMVEDGTLASILDNYAKIQKIYLTTSDLLNATDVVSGMKIKTLGYYNVNDGGGAEFIATDNVSQNEYQLTLQNNLYATMIIKNDEIDFRQIGAIPNDDTVDSKPYLIKYVEICNKLNKTLQLFIPEGNWYFSETHICRFGGVHIKGNSGFPGRTYIGSTNIQPFSNNQNYVWKFGGRADMGDETLNANETNTGNILKNLTFTTDATKNYHVKFGGICLEFADYGRYDEIYFSHFVGCALYIRSSWENYFGILNFRGIYDFKTPVIWLAKKRNIKTVSANISATHFDNLMFEGVSGDCIYLEKDANFVTNQFGTINVEYTYSWLTDENESVQDITINDIQENWQPIYLFNGTMQACSIDTIVFAGYPAYTKLAVTPYKSYYFKSIFNIPTFESEESAIRSDRTYWNLNNISLYTLVPILTAINPYSTYSEINIGNIVYADNIRLQELPYRIFEIEGGTHLNINNLTGSYPYADLMNSIPLYKYGGQGCLCSDIENKAHYGLCIKRGNSSYLTNTLLRYPFEYSTTKKRIYGLRMKAPRGAFYITIRGFVNGVEVSKNYTEKTTGTAGITRWQTIPIEMNFDQDSTIGIITNSADVLFDSLVYIREETIS